MRKQKTNNIVKRIFTKYMTGRENFRIKYTRTMMILYCNKTTTVKNFKVFEKMLTLKF